MLIGDEWCKKDYYLLDKCRCRYGYTSIEDMYDFCMTKCTLKEDCGVMRTPFVYKYYVPGLDPISEHAFEELKTCIVAFSTTPEYDSSGREYHSCGIIYNKVDTVFVKDFRDENLVTTREINEAKHFTSDKECDDALEYVVNNKKPFTIVVVDYKGNKIVCECVHYPNRYWSINGNLQPSLMHKSVNEWHKEHDKNI